MSARAALRSLKYVAIEAAHMSLDVLEHFVQCYAPTPRYPIPAGGVPAHADAWEWCFQHNAYLAECGQLSHREPHPVSREDRGGTYCEEYEENGCAVGVCPTGCYLALAQHTSPAFCVAGERPAADAGDPLAPPAAGRPVVIGASAVVGCDKCSGDLWVVEFPDGITRFICVDHGSRAYSIARADVQPAPAGQR